MGISRRTALKRIESLYRQAVQHAAKPEQDHESVAADHWRAEVASWIEQMKSLLPRLGRGTAENWLSSIKLLEDRIAGRDND